MAAGLQHVLFVQDLRKLVGGHFRFFFRVLRAFICYLFISFFFLCSFSFTNYKQKQS
jgi:hypothetical protein